MRTISPAGLARIKNCTSSRRWVHIIIGDAVFIAERVRPYNRPLDYNVVQTAVGSQVIRRLFVVDMWWR